MRGGRRIIAGLLAAGAILAMVRASPAQEGAGKTRAEVVLDLDGDGKDDRALLVEPSPESRTLTLRVFLSSSPPGATGTPAFEKTDLPHQPVAELKARGRTLLFEHGCGGCTNGGTHTVVIAYRGGSFQVIGYDLEWDGREAQGTCSLNFLSGKGYTTSSQRTGRKPVRKLLRPVPLATWSTLDGQDLCNG